MCIYHLVSTKPDSNLSCDERQLITDYDNYLEMINVACEVHMPTPDSLEVKFEKVANDCLRLGLMEEHRSHGVDGNEFPFWPNRAV